MKLSPETISLLQSFANISPNLLVKPGSKLNTRNAVNSVQARAEVSETFPTQFAIYDLNQLLALLSALGDCEVEFDEQSMTIKSPTDETQYFYADPSLIATPAEKLPTLDVVHEFQITAADINRVQKVAGIVSATMVSIVAKKGKVSLFVNEPKNASSNNYRKELGDCALDFDMRLAMDNFKVVPDTYDVQIARVTSKSGSVAPVFFFSSTSRKLTYLMAADTTSKL